MIGFFERELYVDRAGWIRALSLQDNLVKMVPRPSTVCNIHRHGNSFMPKNTLSVCVDMCRINVVRGFALKRARERIVLKAYDTSRSSLFYPCHNSF